MTNKIVAEVTQEDIDKAEHGNCRKCPIALAINRAMGGLVNVAVSWERIWITGRSEYPRGRVLQFIIGFDSHRPVHPFTFELELP